MLLSYQRFDEATQLTDSVIQELDAAGNLLFEWNSADHLDIEAESTSGTSTSGPWRGDYAGVDWWSLWMTSVTTAADRHGDMFFMHGDRIGRVAPFDRDG